MRPLAVSATSAAPAGDSAMPDGLRKSERLPIALENPDAPLLGPARVVTVADARTMARTLLASESTTNSTPEVVLMASAATYMNVADVPTPFARPTVPFPARVDVAPDTLFTTRMRELFASATYKKPAVSVTTPTGPAKADVLPVAPSANAAVPFARPASVDVDPFNWTRLILLLLLSATRSVPPASTQRPIGRLKVLAAPVGPSTADATLPPASVATVHALSSGVCVGVGDGVGVAVGVAVGGGVGERDAPVEGEGVGEGVVEAAGHCTARMTAPELSAT